MVPSAVYVSFTLCEMQGYRQLWVRLKIDKDHSAPFVASLLSKEGSLILWLGECTCL